MIKNKDKIIHSFIQSTKIFISTPNDSNMYFNNKVTTFLEEKLQTNQDFN